MRKTLSRLIYDLVVENSRYRKVLNRMARLVMNVQ